MWQCVWCMCVRILRIFPDIILRTFHRNRIHFGYFCSADFDQVNDGGNTVRLCVENAYTTRTHLIDVDKAHAAEDKNVRTKYTIAVHQLDVNERQRGITNERRAYLHHKHNTTNHRNTSLRSVYIPSGQGEMVQGNRQRTPTFLHCVWEWMKRRRCSKWEVYYTVSVGTAYIKRYRLQCNCYSNVYLIPITTMSLRIKTVFTFSMITLFQNG